MQHRPATAADDARHAALYDEVMAGYGLDQALPADAAKAPEPVRYASGPEALPPTATADDVHFAEAMGSLPNGAPLVETPRRSL